MHSLHICFLYHIVSLLQQKYHNNKIHLKYIEHFIFINLLNLTYSKGVDRGYRLPSPTPLSPIFHHIASIFSLNYFFSLPRLPDTPLISQLPPSCLPAPTPRISAPDLAFRPLYSSTGKWFHLIFTCFLDLFTLFNSEKEPWILWYIVLDLTMGVCRGEKFKSDSIMQKHINI